MENNKCGTLPKMYFKHLKEWILIPEEIVLKLKKIEDRVQSCSVKSCAGFYNLLECYLVFKNEANIAEEYSFNFRYDNPPTIYN